MLCNLNLLICFQQLLSWQDRQHRGYGRLQVEDMLVTFILLDGCVFVSLQRCKDIREGTVV